MNFFKKYGIYFVLVLSALVLGSAGYITESRKEKNIKNEVAISEPRLTLKKEIKAEETLEVLPAPEAEETYVAEETVKTETVSSKQEIIFTKPIKSGEAFCAFSGNSFVFSETMDDFRVHPGQDYMANADEEILSAASGVVTKVLEDDFWGLCIEIDHQNGIVTKYCALSKSRVLAGDKVEGGAAIAIAGNSAKGESAEGVHLHFEAIKDGKHINPDELFK